MKRSPEDYTFITKNSLLALSFQNDRYSLFEEGTCCLLDKPAEWTSFDVVNKIRYACRAKRVGHAGTLDPFATGLLIVCTGQATKSVSELSNADKEYEGVVRLGCQTTTDDIMGSVLDEQPVPESLERADLEAYCRTFVGEIEQVPPSYSAVKLAGVPAYKRARKGEKVDIGARTVTIHEFSILEFHMPSFSFRIRCSKGTYVRSIARDLGLLIGCGAHLASLRRTSIGSYDVADSVSPQLLSSWIRQTAEPP